VLEAIASTIHQDGKVRERPRTTLPIRNPFFTSGEKTPWLFVNCPKAMERIMEWSAGEFDNLLFMLLDPLYSLGKRLLIQSS
jgi:hypothetical protein